MVKMWLYLWLLFQERMNIWMCETQSEIWGHLHKEWILAYFGQAKVSLFFSVPSKPEGAGIFLAHCSMPNWWWWRLCFPTERLWLPPGPANGGHHVGCLLHHGPALVCGCNCPVHHTCEQPQTGIWVLRSWRTAQVLGHPRTESDRPYDFCADGLLSLHDDYIKGNHSFIH